MSIRVAKLVGISSALRWSQVHAYFPKMEQQQWGAIVAVVTIEAEACGGGELSAVGVELIKRLHEAYYGDSILTGMARVREAVEKVRDEFGEGIVALGMGAILWRENQHIFYGVGMGGVVMQLFRKNLVVPLLGAGNLRSVSGFLQTGDGVVVGTGGLISLVDGGTMAGEWVRARGDVDAWVDQLTPRVHSQESSGVAGVFVGVTAVGREEEQVPKMDLVRSLKRGGNAVSLIVMQKWWQQMWQRWTLKRGERSNPELYVGKMEGKRRGVAVAVAIMIALLLGVSLVFGFIRQKTSEEAVYLRLVQAEVERLVVESKELADLNPMRARALITAALDKLGEYESSGKKSKTGLSWVGQTQSKLNELSREVMKMYAVSELPTFLDLQLVREGVEGNSMDFDGRNLVVLDENKEVLLAITVGSKKSSIVGGGSLLSGARQAAVWVSRGFVFANGGVVELDLVRKTSAVAIKPDSGWGEIGAMDVFGGNVYLVDKGKGQIYRYTAAASGFGERKSWLGRGVAPDFSQVVSMVIDGNIWILTKTGKVEVYSQGTGKAIELTGLDKPLNNPRAVYTDENSQHLYILDGGNKRVVVFSKEGTYEAQYEWEKEGEVVDMVVSEEEKKILLLSGRMLYYLPLAN